VETSDESMSSSDVSTSSDDDDDLGADVDSNLQLDSDSVPSEALSINDSDSDAEPRITTLPLKTKPAMRRPAARKIDPQFPSILARLQDLLPRMKDANATLEEERERGTLEQRQIELMEEGDNDADHENLKDQYIEMNLGLGVLEEKTQNFDDTSSSSSSSSDDEERDIAIGRIDSAASSERKETDVIGKLMGQKRHNLAHVQEVDEG